MDASTVEALKAKYPSAQLLSLSGGGVEVVARITKAEVDLFKSVRALDATRHTATERLVRACIVHPSPEEVGVILNAKPMLIERWADVLLDEAGASIEVEVKKL